MIEQLRHILEHLHFIQPLWFWLFVPLSIILLFVLISNRENNKWQQHIAPHLRSFMFVKGSKNSFRLPIIALIIGISFGILALAGSTWKMKDIPGGKASAVLLIGLDLSHSMLADDISPNRLERMKLKISDLCDANPETDMGLFAFAGTPHIVVPFCSDYSIIKHHIERLHPAMMPIRGSNKELAFQLADSLLNQYKAPSTFVLITDDITNNDISTIESFVKNSIHKVVLIPAATQSGGGMPSFRNQGVKLKDSKGQVRMAVPNMSNFKQLANNSKITLLPLTLDDSDIESIANDVRINKSFILGNEVDDEEWDNKGWWLIFPVLLMILPWFRKGWSVFWSLACILTISSCSPNDKHSDWWYSEDYRAQNLMERGNFEDAALLFKSLPHKGVAYYKSGNYEAALEVFAYNSTAIGLYNKGITLVRLGRLEEASATFQKVIELDPEIQQAAKSLQQTQQMIIIRDSIDSQLNDVTELKKDKSSDEPLQEFRAKSKDEELTSDTEVDELPEDGKRVTDEIETDMSKAEEMERPGEEQQQEAMQKDASKIMLRKISSDPSEFLRRRFKFQKEKHYPDIQELSDI